MSNKHHQTVLFSHWKETCSNFEIAVGVNITPLVNTLETIARTLAQNSEARVNLGTNSSLWVDLRKLWRDLARTQLTFWDGDEEEGEGNSKKENDLRDICSSLAKFTRNLAAGVPENQVRAYENELDIRRLLHYHTSWSAMENVDSISVARILTQTLSNIVTANEELMSKLWETYMKLPEDQVILIRLLASPDPSTLLTVLIFISNCIHGSRKRITMLSRTAVGARVCVSLLDDMLKLFDAEESSQGAQAFDVGYEILTQLIEQRLVPDLYVKFTMPDQIVTPYQTALLKIVDSYLQSLRMNATSPAAPKSITIHKNLTPMLMKCFFDLSKYAQQAVKRALSLFDQPSAGIGTSINDPSTSEVTQPPQAELDVMLPRVCEALVLVTQCIVTITLEAEDQESRENQSEPNLKAVFIGTRSDSGLVQDLIELLRLLDLFLPRINFGKPVSGSSSTESTPAQQPTVDPNGFQYLKRDLVRLLGILCHGSKAVQDRVRDCGGIQVVMNLCVVDERNPYLREHAIFTLHNLLENNPENQTVINAIRPTREWDEEGILVGTPGPVRK